MRTSAGQREVVNDEGKAMALAEFHPERGEDFIGDLDLLAAYLADEVMVMATRLTVLKIQLPIARANRRD